MWWPSRMISYLTSLQDKKEKRQPVELQIYCHHWCCFFFSHPLCCSCGTSCFFSSVCWWFSIFIQLAPISPFPFIFVLFFFCLKLPDDIALRTSFSCLALPSLYLPLLFFWAFFPSPLHPSCTALLRLCPQAESEFCGTPPVCIGNISKVKREREKGELTMWWSRCVALLVFLSPTVRGSLYKYQYVEKWRCRASVWKKGEKSEFLKERKKRYSRSASVLLCVRGKLSVLEEKERLL